MTHTSECGYVSLSKSKNNWQIDSAGKNNQVINYLSGEKEKKNLDWKSLELHDLDQRSGERLIYENIF